MVENASNPTASPAAPTAASSAEAPAFGGRPWLAWVFLLLPFLGLLFAALAQARAGWPDLLPREATILMQAGSLLEDHDLLYTRLDFDRVLLAWRGNPPDLALETGGDGRRITFAYPPLYAAWLAPFLALAPERGIAFANLALLLAAAIATARALSSRLGPWAPALVGVWIFGAIVFTGVFRADGDLFGFSLALLAAALWLGAEGEKAERRALLAGALLAPVALAEPAALALALLLPLAPGGRRRSLLGLALAGFLAGVLLLGLVQWWNGGQLWPTAGGVFKFTPATGYPAVDFPPTSWQAEVGKLAALHWDGAPRLFYGFEPRLWAWNLLYFLAGAQVGLLPYFLPLLLLLALRPRQLGPALGLLMVGQLFFHAFNFWGGPGPLGNRALIPFYGAALVALPGLGQRLGPLAGRRAAAALLLPLALAAPFLLPSWSAPGAWPFARAAFAQESPAARALLLHEASQRWLPGGAVEEMSGIFIAALDENSWVEKRHERLGIAGNRAAFLIGSGRPLAGLNLELGAGAPVELRLRGARLDEQKVLRPDGGVGFRAEPELWRRHAMWWSPLPLYLYRLEIELPAEGATEHVGDTYLQLLPEWPAGGDSP